MQSTNFLKVFWKFREIFRTRSVRKFFLVNCRPINNSLALRVFKIFKNPFYGSRHQQVLYRLAVLNRLWENSQENLQVFSKRTPSWTSNWEFSKKICSSYFLETLSKIQTVFFVEQRWAPLNRWRGNYICNITLHKEEYWGVLDINVLFLPKQVRKTKIKFFQCRCRCRCWC